MGDAEKPNEIGFFPRAGWELGFKNIDMGEGKCGESSLSPLFLFRV